MLTGLQGPQVKAVAQAAITHLLQEAVDTAKLNSSPISDIAFNSMKAKGQIFIDACDETSPAAFAAVARIRLPELMQTVSETAFSMPQALAYRAAKGTLIHSLQSPGRSEDTLAAWTDSLQDSFRDMLTALQEEFLTKQDRDLNRTMIEQQMRLQTSMAAAAAAHSGAAKSGKPVQSVQPLQASSVQNQ